MFQEGSSRSRHIIRGRIIAPILRRIIVAAYDELRQRLREAQTLITAAELLSWDQETMMPRKAAAFRAEEKALLSTLGHARATDPGLGELIARCESDDKLCADEAVAANLREIRRDFDRATKIPSSLVKEMSETNSLAMEAWREARANNEFERFRPFLDKQLELNRAKAQCWGTPASGELYDALLDDFEPGTSAVSLEAVFAPLRSELSGLLEALAASPTPADDAIFRAPIPVEAQAACNVDLVRTLGFDTDAGRLDTSTHPFSTGLGPGDTRITTRYREDALLDAIGSTMHEAGHALYEQGLPKTEAVGQPIAEPLGLGIHESQSRLWENHVGRSREFCEWLIGELRGRFDVHASRTSDELFAAFNTVRPNLIRVESDEATYHFHIMLRFDLERAMLSGNLPTAELPRAWNERIKNDLGLDVPDDAHGCLQDVHWSMGAIGYFPTYTLGSLYAAQMWEAALRDEPGLPGEIGRGEFSTLLNWLRERVHRHGRRYTAAELCKQITGGALSHEPLIRHLDAKLRPLYRIVGAVG